MSYNNQETDSESQRAASDSDTNTKEKQGPELSGGYPLQPLEEELTAPPSESDVLAILSSVSMVQNRVTSESLKQAQKSATKQHKQGGRKGSRSQSEGSSSGSASKGETGLPAPNDSKSLSSQQKSLAGLHIKHGKPQSVTAGLLGLRESGSTRQPFYSNETHHKQPVKRKRKAVISDDSGESESEIDLVTIDTEPSASTTLLSERIPSAFPGTTIVPAASRLGLGGETHLTSLTVHINKELLRPSGDEDPFMTIPSQTLLSPYQESSKLDYLSPVLPALHVGEVGGEGTRKEQVLTTSKPKKKKKKKHKKKSKWKIVGEREDEDEDEGVGEEVGDGEKHENVGIMETGAVENDGLKLRIFIK